MNQGAFVLSLIVAGLAGIVSYSFLESKQSEYIEKYGTEVNTVVATKDIKQFELIDDRNVKTKPVPKNFLAPGGFTKVEDVVNNIALTPIQKGEQITRPRVTIPGLQTGLSRQVAQGKRAISIPVREDTSSSLLIKPGDRVDVMALLDCCKGRKDLLKVKTVLQDVLVLSTGKSVTNTLPLVNLKRDDEIRKLNLSTYTNFDTVTLELSPVQAQKIVFIMSGLGSSLYLSLRNNDDKESKKSIQTGLFDVLGNEAVEAKNFWKSQN